MSHRIPQVEANLQRAISEVLQRRLSDPRIQGIISVTRVKVSPDLHEAYVFVSVLPEGKQSMVVSALNHAVGHIQRLVRKAVVMRQVPRLSFRSDESLKKQSEVFEALNRAGERTGPEPEDTEAGEGQSGDASEADGSREEPI